MKENLDKLVERGESLDIIQRKTEEIQMISTDMKSNATSIKRNMWWKNKRMMVMAIVVFIILIFIILLIACGGLGFSKC